MINNQKNFPLVIDNFRFIERFAPVLSKGRYSFALYHDDKGMVALAKQWTGSRKNRGYYHLRNEIAAYESMSVVFDHRGDALRAQFPDVRIPQFFSWFEESERLIMLIEKIDAVPLKGRSQDEIVNAYEHAMQFLSKLNELIAETKSTKLARRTGLHIAVLYPLYLIKTLFRFPQSFHVAVEGTLLFYARISRLLGKSDLVFAHRDLSTSNILVQGNTLCLVDFEMAAQTVPLMEFSTSMLRLWNDSDALDFSFEKRLSETLLKTSDVWCYQALAVYTAFVELATEEHVDYARTIQFFEHIISSSQAKPQVSNEKNNGARKKIIFSTYDSVGNPFYNGGGARAIHEVAQRLLPTYDVTVVAGQYPGSRNTTIDGIEYRYVGSHASMPRFSQLAFWIRLPLRVQKETYDLWIESFTPPFTTGFLPLFTKKPIIGLVHSLPARQMHKKYLLPFELVERIGLRLYKKIITLTEASKAAIEKINSRADITIIGNGVSQEQRSKIENVDRDYITFLGRIDLNEKGLDLLLKAYAEGLQTLPHTLVIAGSGTKHEEKQLKDLIYELGIQSKVFLAGYVNEKQKEELFARSACVVMPSRTETLSFVALEALAHRIPLIVFDIEGFQWLSDTACVKVRSFETHGLAAAIQNVIHDRELRSSLIRNGEAITAELDWDRVAQQYADFIGQCLPSSIAQNDAARYFIEQIKNNKKFYFVSPHLDDALFSAGDLISFLTQHGAEVHIVSVFTDGGEKPYTLSAQQFLKQCGATNAHELFMQRRKEDEIAVSQAGARYHHLGFVDAVWRKKQVGPLRQWMSTLIPEFLHVYPTYRTHIVRNWSPTSESALKREISDELRSIIGSDNSATVFCPAAVGSHVDHRIIQQVCKQTFGDVIEWADVPYVQRTANSKLLQSNNHTALIWDVNVGAKSKLIGYYTTQMNAMGADTFSHLAAEKFFIPKQLFSKELHSHDTQPPTISIGIPAHNEEKNITHLLKALLAQRIRSTLLKEIIVIVDGCTDGTVERIEAIEDDRIRMVIFNENKGLPAAQNEIVRQASGDFLILLDADIVPRSLDFIDELVRPLLADSTVGLVSAAVEAVKPTGWFETIIADSQKFKNDLYAHLNQGKNLYLCHGRARAFSKVFYKQLEWPNAYGEDAYSYFVCLQKGFRFAYVPSARIAFRSPQTLEDHLKQSFRFIQGRKNWQRVFSNDFVRRSYRISPASLFSASIRAMVRNPLTFISYCCIVLGVRFLSVVRIPHSGGEMYQASPTSKKLF